MFKSLLVPLDGSQHSERSLPIALGIARASDAFLHLAHVHVPNPPDQLLSNTQFHFEGLDVAAYEEREREEEREYLTGLVNTLGTDGDSALLEGDVVDALGTHAERVDADAIFMTTHGRTGLPRMWWGSVADALLRHTHLPLLVIHPGEAGHVPADVRTFRHILVTLDGSERAEAVLGPAADLAEATGARLTLLRVVSPRGLHVLDGPEDYLADVARRMRATGLRVGIHVRAAEGAAPAIARIGEEIGADLIAMATHGYGGVKRALLGSVASKVLKISPLPMLVQRA